jgi:hypothetical protein
MLEARAVTPKWLPQNYREATGDDHSPRLIHGASRGSSERAAGDASKVQVVC